MTEDIEPQEEESLSRVHRVMQWFREPHYRRLLAYLLVVALTCASFAIVLKDDNERHRESQKREAEISAVLNAAKERDCRIQKRYSNALLKIIEKSTIPVEVPPGATDALRATIEHSNAAKLSYYNSVVGLIPHPHCSTGSPSTPSPTTAPSSG